MLQHPRLGVGAVQQRDVGAAGALPHQGLDLLDDPARLVAVGEGLIHADRLAGAAVGPQALAEALGVVADQGVGGVEDVAVGAVVLLQADHALHPEVALEVAHVADLGAAETVDRLVVVAHAEQARPALAAAVGQQRQPLVLQAVGVLELIHQDVAETGLVMPPDRLVALEQFVAAEQKLGEIHNCLALALSLILDVKLDPAPGVVVPGIDRRRPQAGLFLGVDEVLQLPGREFLVVDVEGFEQALDGGQLVARVEDLEQLGQAGVAVMGPQEAVAQAVEGADPHPPGVDREHRRQPREHFLGGLVGKGHRQDALGAAVAVLDQPGDPRGEHPRLARAGAGEDQGMLGRQRHGGELFRVEVVEELGHGAGEVDKCTAEPGIVPPGTTAGTPVDGCRNRSRSRNTGLQSRTL